MLFHSVGLGAPRPVGVVFRTDTLVRVGGAGDNWCQTWADDDAVIASMDDGNWLLGPDSFSNHLYRIGGGPDEIEREEFPGYPRFIFNTGGWFGYGICSVNGVLYSMVSKCPRNSWSGPFRGMKMLKSADQGVSWTRVNARGEERRVGLADPIRYDAGRDEMFFLEEGGREAHDGLAYPFSSCAFAQQGKDHGASQDGFVYIYSPEGSRSRELLLARVRRAQLGLRSAWEFFGGLQDEVPQWTPDLGQRVPIHRFPAQDRRGNVFGWYSWLPSVVWNSGLGVFIMVNGGTYGGQGMTSAGTDYYSAWMHTRSGSLGFWWAENPWGPWTEFFYSEEWVADSPGNRTYQPKLSPKWMSSDGREMVLIWSDAMKNAQGRSHTVNYRWNQMKITLRVQ